MGWGKIHRLLKGDLPPIVQASTMGSIAATEVKILESNRNEKCACYHTAKRVK